MTHLKQLMFQSILMRYTLNNEYNNCTTNNELLMTISDHLGPSSVTVLTHFFVHLLMLNSAQCHANGESWALASLS